MIKYIITHLFQKVHINFLRILAKYYTYENKFHNKRINIRGFEAYAKVKFKNEMYIAKINNASCRRNLVLTDSLVLLLIFGYCPGIFRSTSAFFRSLTTAGDNRDRCQDTRLGQYSYLAHDRLLKFMALICGFI